MFRARRRMPLGVALYKGACRIARKIPFLVCSYLPKKKRILFTSMPDYSDNARVLCDYIRENRILEEFEIAWIVDDTDVARQIRSEGMHCYRRWMRAIGPLLAIHAARSQYVFFTHVLFPSYYRVPSDQTVVNLWHGCGYKACGISKVPFTYALVPGEFFVPIKAKSFDCNPKKVLSLGYPRYDLIVRPRYTRKEVCSRLNIHDSEKFVLWMPTFRTHRYIDYAESVTAKGLGLPLLSSDHLLRDVDAQCMRLGIRLLVKRHPSQIAYRVDELRGSLRNISFISQGDLNDFGLNIYDIYPYADALISDYSSAAIDYLLVDKPLGFVLDDYDNYARARGFSMKDPLSYMPGSHIYNVEDLLTFIAEISRGEDHYEELRASVFQKMQNRCDDYCGRLMNRLLMEEQG